jgi:hypothetical protein
VRVVAAGMNPGDYKTLQGSLALLVSLGMVSAAQY